MQIYTGSNYSITWQQVIQKCILAAKENPFVPQTIIVNDPSLVEEAFLQYTDIVFTIEIMTLAQLLKQQQTSSKIPLTKIEKILLVKEIVEQHKDTFLYQPHTLFTTMEQILTVFDMFYYANTKSLPTSFVSTLSKEKITLCFTLYQEFLQRIPSTHTFHRLEEVNLTIKEHVFYIMEDCILQPKYLAFITTLAKQNTVYIISNHNKKDTRISHQLYQKYFATYEHTELSLGRGYQKHLTSQWFASTTKRYLESHPFTILKETNPIEEVRSVCFSIYQATVEEKISYRDIAIYYPNPQYLELLQQTLASFSIPCNMTTKTREYPSMQACLLLLQYANTMQEEDFLLLVDTLQLKKCTSFQQSNYYKKRFYETKQIFQEEYIALQQHLQTTYCLPLATATTLQQIASIISTFLQEEIVYDDTLVIVQSYIASLSSFTTPFTISDTLQLFQATKPMHQETETLVSDHVYLFNYQQTASALLSYKNIYLLGLNETVVPATIKDEGMLLNTEIIALGLTPSIADRLSLQQNQFLKLVTIPAKQIVFSYAMISTTNETLLPSSYLLQMQSLFTIPYIDTTTFYNHPANAHRLYALGGYDSQKTIVNQHLSWYQQRHNQPLPLSSLPYAKTLSASQLETYNGCPYRYFCQYGLQLQPWQTPTLQAQEIGSLVHYLLEVSTPFFQNRNQAAQIDNTLLTNHLQQHIQVYLQKNPVLQQKLQQPTNAFFITCIEKDMVNTIRILMQQMQVSSFEVTNTEENIQATYQDITMKGFVDRIDVCKSHQKEQPDYLKVIDYKSSTKDLDLTLAMQGFNMQMLLYIDMLSKQKHLQKGAVLYFNTKKRILKSTLSIVETEDATTFFSLYRMNGYVVEDVVTDIDQQIDRTSAIIKARHIKKTDTYTGNILTASALDTVLHEVGKHISYLYQQIFTGHIDIAPKASNNPTIHTKVNPCTYCSYQAICNIDIFYNKPTLVKNIDLKTILGGDTNDKH